MQGRALAVARVIGLEAMHGVVLGGLWVALGCQPAATGGGTVSPGGNGAVSEGPDPEGREEGDNIGDLEARLRRLDEQQSELVSSSDGSFDSCEDLCSLAASICGVKAKLCEIADRHPGEEEYQSLCREAELECSEAEDSCVACVQARERSEGTTASEPSP